VGEQFMPVRQRLRVAAAWVTCALVAATGLVAAAGTHTTIPAGAATSSTCAQFATIPVASGAYSVQTDEWNSSATQCVSTSGGADFKVTQSAINAATNGAPGSYPSIYRGCHWGSCTQASGLPLQVSGLGDPTTSWSTTQPTSGTYDTAYDIWFNKTATTNGQPDGAELMIWLNHRGPVQPAGSLVGTVSLGGYIFDVWYAPMGGWNYIAYVLQSGRASITNLDLGTVARDVVRRGYLDPSWYLIGVEAGFELWQGGAGMTTNSFSFLPGGGGVTTPSTTTTSTTTTSTTTTTTIGPSQLSCAVTYRVASQWINGSPPNGFTASVVVRNTGPSSVSHWALQWAWPAPGQIARSAWNAKVVQTGASVTASNLSYNGTIAPGGTTAFGFQGTWVSTNPIPSTFSCT
jgi:cellulose 1,4-beta-cellobiosidase